MVNDQANKSSGEKRAIGRAILTDVQFWIPVAVLVFGLLLLISLH